ncbi:MAG: hypothetical protein Q8P24_11640, partial [Desulfobacterales bacterium]|nr:hypothetical protein [Desulfobacterales bacterium]
MGQVRDRWLCHGVLGQKLQIPSIKLQTTLKFQYSMTQAFQDETSFGFSILVIGNLYENNHFHASLCPTRAWVLFGIYNLIIVI